MIFGKYGLTQTHTNKQQADKRTNNKQTHSGPFYQNMGGGGCIIIIGGKLDKFGNK